MGSSQRKAIQEALENSQPVPYKLLLRVGHKTLITSEFKDDIVEVLIGEAVKILSGDHENIMPNQLAEKSVEENN